MKTKERETKARPERMRVTASGWGRRKDGTIIIIPPHDLTRKGPLKQPRKAG